MSDSPPGKATEAASYLIPQAAMVIAVALSAWAAAAGPAGDSPVLQKVLTWKNFVHAASGGLSSAISITALYPLETVRTRLQVDPKLSPRSSLPLVLALRRREGLSSLYRGWSSLVLALFLTNFCYFYIFHGLHEMVGGAATSDLGCGAAAGVVAVLLTNPFWVVNTRLKLQGVVGSGAREYSGVVNGLSTIVRDEGVTTLWAGTSSSLLLVSNPALQFMTYEWLKRKRYILSGGVSLPDELFHFLNGGLAKVVATVATYPMQLVQTRRRAGMTHISVGSLGVIGQIASVIRSEGVCGVFQGLESKLTQTCLNAALMFLLYEKLFELLGLFSGR